MRRDAAARVVVVEAAGPVPVGRASELVRVRRRRGRRRVVGRVVEERRRIGVRVLGRVRSSGGENVSVTGSRRLWMWMRLRLRCRRRRGIRQRRVAPVPPAAGAVASDVSHWRVTETNFGYEHRIIAKILLLRLVLKLK